MEWYQFLEAFFAGAFLANSVPHFVHGISGDKFPTPFAKPPGKGLSPAPVNAIWALANIFVGYLLLKGSKLDTADHTGMIIFFLGVIAMTIMLSTHFPKKDKE